VRKFESQLRLCTGIVLALYVVQQLVNHSFLIASIEAAWLSFRTRYSGISTGLAPDVASVEIADRGTYHRLRIAAFTSRDAANAFCATLQGPAHNPLVRGR